MDIGTGTSIAFASGFLAEILSVSGPDASRKSIETSHMGTSSNHTFTPGDLVDRGEMSVEIAFDPETEPPVDDAPSECVITFPDSGATTWTFTGFMTGFSPSTPLEDRMTATCRIKVSGGIVVA